ncbi:putative NAD(P)H nitroreductase MhqN [Paenibacillus sp. CCS19]|uniref:nitroreductase family protein n=1 Tax=Paenibacillus sp. CCS19 TaxID=3158387 RepID=UPI002569E3B1|nr:nitroreductase family protein [Paenibacillus cellulosilyticus]GMK41218.1 putative NAD(P)H nitroreductase MhqN [Paenibacillus cellulosilyticus]
MSEFQSVLIDRRSANRFVEHVDIARHELEEIFALTKYTPTAYNLQHAHYVAVTDRRLIERIYEAAHKQYKIRTASAVIFVLGNTKAHLNAPEINEGLKTLGLLSEQEYQTVVDNTIQFYESRGEDFQREDAVRNASLSAMNLMLIAKDKGWDTCPMHSIEEQALKELIEVPEGFIPVMMITIGHASPESMRPRGYRKPTGEYVTYIG